MPDKKVLTCTSLNLIGVALCFGQDEAGKKMTKQVAGLFSKQEITCQVEWPGKGKDWNNMLLASKESVAQLDQQLTN